MPELPEVETIRRSLSKRILNKKIINMQIYYPQIIKNKDTTHEEFKSIIKNSIIKNINRRGKYLIFEFDKKHRLIIHLRMTGKLLYGKGTPDLDKHIHLVFYLADDEYLVYHDVRKFGMVYLQKSADILVSKGFDGLGPEPLADEFTPEVLKTSMVNRRQKIKSFLLDQRMIAGIGNIYADEILFQAGVDPARTVDTLLEEEIYDLHSAIKDRLNEAVKNNGTTIKDYVDAGGTSGAFQNLLQVYGKAGQPCPVCTTVLKRTLIGGRGTSYCPDCQK